MPQSILFKSCVVTLFFLLALSANLANAQYTNSLQAPLYTGPSSSTQLSHPGIPPNTKLKIIRSEGRFSLVQTNDGELGWIQRNLLKESGESIAQREREAALKKKREEEQRKKREAEKQKRIEDAKRRAQERERIQQQEQAIANQNISPSNVQRRKTNATIELPSTGVAAQNIQPSSQNTIPQVVEVDPRQQQIQNTRISHNEMIQSIQNTLDDRAPIPDLSAGNNTDTTSDENRAAIYDSSPETNRLELLVEENRHLRNELQKAKTYMMSNVPSIETEDLYNDTELLKNQVELLKAENQRLQDGHNDSNFLNTLLVLIGGTILGFILSKMFSANNSRSDW